MTLDSRTPVTFTNRDGLRLVGILHEPAVAGPTDLAAILLSPGVKMRVGPQRLYNRIAETFLRHGLPVLRFDFYGLGDSEGSLSEDLLRDVYNHIEVGRFVDDTICAMDWMAERCGARRFVLSGLCGGAISGLLAGARDPRVAGLHALGLTAVLASRSADPSRYVTVGQLKDMRETYFQKLWSPKAWLRLLSLRSDYRVIWRALTLPARQPAAPSASAKAAAPPAADDNANPLFPPAFFSMLERRRPMLLVFGGGDRLQWEFDEKFIARHRERLAALPPVFDVHIVAGANHVLSLGAWQQEMLDTTSRWLRERFPHDILDAAPRPALAGATSAAVDSI